MSFANKASASFNFELAMASCLLNLASAAFTKASLSLTVNDVAVRRWVATENFRKSAVFFRVTDSSEPAVER